MDISRLMMKMVAASEGNLHDIEHFMKVYAYARTIGIREGLEGPAQRVLEAAAILHDIACPLCREKYGCADGRHQELEGGPMAEAFLQDSGFSEAEIRRIAFLVGHHHTPEEVDGPDYQILLEADYLVNAHESPYSREQIVQAEKTLFKTGAGRAMLAAMYLR